MNNANDKPLWFKDSNFLTTYCNEKREVGQKLEAILVNSGKQFLNEGLGVYYSLNTKRPDPLILFKNAIERIEAILKDNLSFYSKGKEIDCSLREIINQYKNCNDRTLRDRAAICANKCAKKLFSIEAARLWGMDLTQTSKDFLRKLEPYPLPPNSNALFHVMFNFKDLPRTTEFNGKFEDLRIYNIQFAEIDSQSICFSLNRVNRLRKFTSAVDILPESPIVKEVRSFFNIDVDEVESPYVDSQVLISRNSNRIFNLSQIYQKKIVESLGLMTEIPLYVAQNGEYVIEKVPSMESLTFSLSNSTIELQLSLNELREALLEFTRRWVDTISKFSKKFVLNSRNFEFNKSIQTCQLSKLDEINFKEHSNFIKAFRGFLTSGVANTVLELQKNICNLREKISAIRNDWAANLIEIMVIEKKLGMQILHLEELKKLFSGSANLHFPGKIVDQFKFSQDLEAHHLSILLFLKTLFTDLPIEKLNSIRSLEFYSSPNSIRDVNLERILLEFGKEKNFSDNDILDCALDLMKSIPGKEKLFGNVGREHYLDFQLNLQAILSRKLANQFVNICISRPEESLRKIFDDFHTQYLKKIMDFLSSQMGVNKADGFASSGDYFAVLFWEYFINHLNYLLTYIENTEIESKVILIKEKLKIPEINENEINQELRRALHDHLVKYEENQEISRTFQ